MARYCSSCGKEITEDTKFCPSCGKPVISEVVPIQSQTVQSKTEIENPYAEFGKGITYVVLFVLVIVVIVLIVKFINHPYWSI
jgi:uncharacterized membrane protein YvbJ